MAEALVYIHGYAGGVITHYDIHIGQYLLDTDYSVKMSDFNRAEPLLWNEEDQEYCGCRLGHAHGCSDLRRNIMRMCLWVTALTYTAMEI